MKVTYSFKLIQKKQIKLILMKKKMKIETQAIKNFTDKVNTE
jgi:hypothetical protein